MKHNDQRTYEQIRKDMFNAAANNNTQAFLDADNELRQFIKNEITTEYREAMEDLRKDIDSQILTSRNPRRAMTAEERQFCEKFAEIAQSADPKQAIRDAHLVMPQTILDDITEDISANHPLLSQLDFIPTGLLTRWVTNENDNETAIWGDITDEIIKELSLGFKTKDTALSKMSAFIPVCKQTEKYAPEQVLKIVKDYLYNSIANGWEIGAVRGNSEKEPIGMICDVSKTAPVINGVRPLKEAIKITSFDIATIGNLLSIIAVNAAGVPRPINNLILLANPVDIYSKVNPAIKFLTGTGEWKEVFDQPIKVIPTIGVNPGEAVFGLAKKYKAMTGTPAEGAISISEEARFLQDQTVFLIKAFGNGYPTDNNAFLRLDISELRPAKYEVVIRDDTAKSNDAGLSALSLGNASISPSFTKETTEYSASTANSTNTINVMPSNAAAKLIIKHYAEDIDGVVVPNGTAITWATGENRVVIDVIAEDGTSTKTYTVTVTKS